MATKRKLDGRVLERLYETVEARRDAVPEESYTAKLFLKGREKIAQKVGEEAVEVVIEAVAGGERGVDKGALAAESADLLYHLSVLWADCGLKPAEVWAALERREGVSGLAEKAARTTSGKRGDKP